MKKALTILVAAFLLGSCEFVGLGPQIDITGPVVTITAPVPETPDGDISVLDLFDLTGIAGDNDGVARMSVTMDYYNNDTRILEPLGREWRYENNAWQIRESASEPWTAYGKNSNSGQPPRWDVQDKSVYWNLPILLDGFYEGEFFISIRAWDAAQNTDANSFQKIKVIYDNDRPNIMVGSPVYHKVSAAEKNSSPPEEWDSYELDYENSGLTFGYLQYFHNEEIEFEWEIDDEFGLGSLIVEFTNQFDLDSLVGKEVYYHYEITNPAKKGSLTILAADITASSAGKTCMQVVTTLTDLAGNTEYRSNGWFIYYPDADKPWADLSSFADPENPDRVSIRQGSEKFARAYDDDGVKSITYTLFKLQDTGLDDDETVLPFEKTVTLSNTQTNASWTFSAAKEVGWGRFRIEAQAVDIDGVKGPPIRGFFTIESNVTPFVKEISSPASSESLFGDGTGNFTVQGIAEIDDLETSPGSNSNEIASVRLLWINPEPEGSNPVDTQLAFYDKTNPGWDSPGSSDEFTLWDCAVKQVNDLGELEQYSFSKELNIFTGLNVGKGKNHWGPQTFLVRVKSAAGLASVFSFTTKGDISAPKPVITTVTVTPAAGTAKVYQAGELLPVLREKDKVRVAGTWTDDSLTKWSGLEWDSGTPPLKDLFEDLTVTWAEEAFPSVSLGKGTWETGDLTFAENNTEAIANIEVSLKDWGGNKGSENKNVVIETDNPTLLRISSDATDGTYGPHSDSDSSAPGVQNYIDIYLEFNKAVRFSGGSGSNPYPYLELNNQGTAAYQSGNESTKIYFRYQLSGEGGDTGRLNVTGINTNGNESWKSINEDGAEGMDAVMQIPAETSPLSLAGGKNIVIDKTPPQLRSFVSSNNTSLPYGAGSVLYFSVNFTEPVRFKTGSTGATASNLYMSLKGGNLLSQSARAGYQNAAGASSILFAYTVKTGDNTDDGIIGIHSFNLGSGVVIEDYAGNALDPALPAEGDYANGKIDRDLKVDTSAPLPPSISGISAQNYYEAPAFTITGIESADAGVEYSLDKGATWNNYTGSLSKNEAGTSYSTDPISISVNGTYHIIARQSDNAVTTANRSANSAEAGPVKVDRGNLLLRLGSSTPDGIYADTSGRTITVDLVFRIPVYLPSPSTGGDGPKLTLNLDDGGTKTAVLPNAGSHSADFKTWTFTYTLSGGDHAERLDVTGIDFNHASFTDDGGTVINEWITLPDAGSENRFGKQKAITVLTGVPEPTAIAFAGGDNPRFTITFDRDIYKGTGSDLYLTIEQLITGYKVPAVLTEAQYNAYFYTDEEKKNLGEVFYELGTNGYDNANAKSDTTKKYILKYQYDSGDITSGPNATPASTAAIRDHIRGREIVKVPVSSSQVTIAGKVLTVDLSGSFALPVKGAKYNYSLSAGFVKDFLEKTNAVLQSYVTDPSTEDTSKTITLPGVEKPVIRVNKANETITGTGNARQARQPATTGMKMDCRTPGAEIRYTLERNNHPVGPIIKRGTAANVPAITTNDWPTRITGGYDMILPTIGVRQGNETGFTTDANYQGQKETQIERMKEEIEKQKEPKITMPAGVEPTASSGLYTVPVDLGDNNYALGGMKYMITAKAFAGNTGSDMAYEAAYRSVLVFVNNGSAGNNAQLDLGGTGNRLYVRGGDTIEGGVLSADFPISRDEDKPGTARLMTPINYSYTTNTNDVNRTLGAEGQTSGIPDTYQANGQYLWFWITWKLNDAPAYIDIHRGAVGDNGPVGETKNFVMAYTDNKDFFPVTPGDTRVIETRNAYTRPNGNAWVIHNSSKGPIGWVN